MRINRSEYIGDVNAEVSGNAPSGTGQKTISNSISYVSNAPSDQHKKLACVDPADLISSPRIRYHLKNEAFSIAETRTDDANALRTDLGQLLSKLPHGEQSDFNDDKTVDNKIKQTQEKLEGDIKYLSFIDEAMLEEAREFRQKGYNPQVPEVDPNLVTQLRKAVDALNTRQRHQTNVEGPLGSLFLLNQTLNIAPLAAKLSNDRMRDWVRDTLPGKDKEKTGKTSMGDRSAAQSLVRRLESTLQTLIHIVDILCSAYVCDRPDKRHEMVIAELTDTFSPDERSAVLQAMERMMTEDEGRANWHSLVQAWGASWASDKLSTLVAMNKTVRHEAKKAGEKAGQLLGDARTFFTDIELYLYSLSNELRRASVDVSQSISHDEKENQLAEPGLNCFLDKLDTRLIKNKLKLGILSEVIKKQGYRFNPLHGKTSKQLTADSIIRSILWQWQQPAIKIQYASGALLSKVDELKIIGEMFSSDAVAHDRGSEQEGSDTPDKDVLVRQWVNDRIEQLKLENQQAEKLAVLEKLLDGNIDNARALTGRLREKEKNMESLLKRLRASVPGIVMELPELAPLMKKVDTLLPKVASGLDKAIAAMDKATHSATTRNFAEAKKQAGIAQLLAIKVKEMLSTESALLTKRPLDEHSRGSRLAKHWANIISEQNQSSDPLAEATQLLSSLKNKGLLEGVISTEDPEGYLFATRLASELDNARNGELILPMSPEHYAALEKGLVEYIVKWGQRRLSRGGARLIIEMAFEQGMCTVSFGISNAFRIPYKVIKSLIKLPYTVNKINNYIMPGDDKPYKAINNLLAKKLKQLGFNLITAPLPSIAKLAIGAATTAGAAAYNSYNKKNENTFSAVYERVVEGKKSKQIKIDSPEGMIFDSMVDGASTAIFEGAGQAWKSGKIEHDFIGGNRIRTVYPAGINTKALPLTFNESQNQSDAELEDKSDGNHNSQGNRLRPKRAVEEKRTEQPLKDVQTRVSYDTRKTYRELSEEDKKRAYSYAIIDTLDKIEKDNNLSSHIRNEAKEARSGLKKLVPVSLEHGKLNNTLFLPDRKNPNSGVLIRLNAETTYSYVTGGRNLPDDLKDDMPYNSHEKMFYPDTTFWVMGESRLEIFDSIKRGEISYNFETENSMSISDISSELFNTILSDYKHRGIEPENNLMMSRSISGAQLPVPEVSITEVPLRITYNWGGSSAADYLRSIEKPFSSFAGMVQLQLSANAGDTIQEAEEKKIEAEKIGSWVDATAGVLTSITPAGIVFNSVQTASAIIADLADGKDPDPLAVVGLVVGSIPGGQISAKIAKATRTGAKIFTYSLQVGNKFIDLTIVANSIKIAVETGEPLAIYQAFLASGMSVKNSYEMTRNMSVHLKLSNRIEDSATLEKLEEIKNESPGHSVSLEIPESTFRVGDTQLYGKINKGKINISKDGGVTWREGSDLYLLAFRLQNAGGFHKFNDIVIGKHIFTAVPHSSKNHKEIESIATSYSLDETSSTKVEKARQDYKNGKEISNNTEYNHYNDLSYDKKIELFINPGTDAKTRGILAEKINNDNKKILAYETAKMALDWKLSAKRSTNVVLAPQTIFLKNRPGVCLPASILMGRALQIGLDAKLADDLMDIYLAPDVGENFLYKSLTKLHADGISSKFGSRIIPDVTIETLISKQSSLFPSDNTSVRVDIFKHAMLMSKVTNEGKSKYVFYDPNYGLAYFESYRDMIDFFKEKLKSYSNPGNLLNIYQLDYSRILDFKINGKTLDEIIGDASSTEKNYLAGATALVNTGSSETSEFSSDKLTKHQVRLNNITKLLLKIQYSGEKINYFDLKTHKFKKTDDFTVFNTDISFKKECGTISTGTKISLLEHMERKTENLIEQLKVYTGTDREDVSNNLDIIQFAIENIKQDINHVDRDLLKDMYVLVRKSTNPEDVSNHYGLVDVQFSIRKKIF